MNVGAILNPKQDLYVQIDFFAEHGFAYVDLPLDYPLYSKTFDAEKLKDALARRDLPLYGQTPVMLPFGSPYPDIRKEAVETAVEAARALSNAGALAVGLHPDPTYLSLTNDIQKWNAESFLSISKKSPGPFLVEVLYDQPYNTVGGVREFIDAITSLKLIIDVGHVNIAKHDCGSSLGDFLETGLVEVIHVDDNDGFSDQHLALGRGSIDWKQVKRELKEHNYDGNVTIECYNATLEEIVESKRFLESL